MNRKRNDFEFNDCEDNRFGPITKKLRSPVPPSFDKLHLNGKNGESMSLNGSIKSTIISNLPLQVLQDSFFFFLRSSDFENNCHCIYSIDILCNLISCFFSSSVYMRIVVIRSMS
jgi:hypothetical protein